MTHNLHDVRRCIDVCKVVSTGSTQRGISATASQRQPGGPTALPTFPAQSAGSASKPSAAIKLFIIETISGDITGTKTTVLDDEPNSPPNPMRLPFDKGEPFLPGPNSCSDLSDVGSVGDVTPRAFGEQTPRGVGAGAGGGGGVGGGDVTPRDGGEDGGYSPTHRQLSSADLRESFRASQSSVRGSSVALNLTDNFQKIADGESQVSVNYMVSSDDKGGSFGKAYPLAEVTVKSPKGFEMAKIRQSKFATFNQTSAILATSFDKAMMSFNANSGTRCVTSTFVATRTPVAPTQAEATMGFDIKLQITLNLTPQAKASKQAPPSLDLSIALNFGRNHSATGHTLSCSSGAIKSAKEASGQRGVVWKCSPKKAQETITLSGLYFLKPFDAASVVAEDWDKAEAGAGFISPARCCAEISIEGFGYTTCPGLTVGVVPAEGPAWPANVTVATTPNLIKAKNLRVWNAKAAEVVESTRLP